MSRLVLAAMALLMALVYCTRLVAAVPGAGPDGSVRLPASSGHLPLGPPPQTGPVIVHASFEINGINAINDEAQTFEFAGVLKLKWRDPRRGFDPAATGMDEKIFQGEYQFNEISTGWYPQVVLVNESGLNDKGGVILRVQPDGSSTLIQTLNASVKTALDFRRFPFDRQRLEAVFEVLGFDRDEVVLQVGTGARDALAGQIRIPQWSVEDVRLFVRDHAASYAGRRGTSSALIVSVDVQRQSWFEKRLIIIPLIVIVLLSFSVFWMDRSSLGERINVSFIGVLTAVAYQLVINDQLPHISYVTLMHSFLSISFLTVCATVVISLVVGKLDQQGKVALGDRIDQRCRWLFPLVYVGLNLTIVGVEYLFF
jgi:hypothetical protein